MLPLHETSDNTDFEFPRLEPLIHHDNIVTVGNPSIIMSPVEDGIRCTVDDQVVYTFPITYPIPCPFDITECQDGFTLSLWIRDESGPLADYRNYMKIGDSFSLYKPSHHPQLAVRWNTHRAYTWYNSVPLSEDVWVHLAVAWTDTDTTSYIDGEMYQIYPRQTSEESVVIGQEIQLSADTNPGTFSIGKIEFWSGTASPSFIWWLYQEGLWSSAAGSVPITV